jgi:hypothetical protein
MNKKSATSFGTGKARPKLGCLVIETFFNLPQISQLRSASFANPGTDVMNFKIFSPKNRRKIVVFVSKQS